MVVSYWTPGSAQRQAASAIWLSRSRGVERLDDLAAVAGGQVPVARRLGDRLHELVGDAHRVVGVLVLDRGEALAVDATCRSRRRAARAAFSSSLALHQMKSSMSGWSTSSTTIFAARRVLPPDLIVPAQESAPRMKLTGPEASAALREVLHRAADVREVDARSPSRRGRSCPPWCSSRGSTPSCPRRYRMKQAEHCGCSSKPTLNQTGRVEGRHLVEQDVGELGLEGVGVLVGGEVAALAAPAGDRAGDAADHLLDRATRARREPSWPRKYFWATMLVAFCDQVVGNSTPRCSNAGFSGSPMTASRISHSTSSKGWTPAVVWRRSQRRPPCPESSHLQRFPASRSPSYLLTGPSPAV